MKPIRKISSIVLSALLLTSFSGCSGSSAEAVTTSRWVDSDLFENIDAMAAADLKDDYAAAVTFEWAALQSRDFSYDNGIIGDTDRKVIENKRALLDDPSLQGADIELLRTADGLFCDWEYRNSLGVEPLSKYLGYIDEIRTIDDVSAYMLDNERNPFAVSLVEISSAVNDSVDDTRALVLRRPELSLEDKEYYICMTADGYKEKEKVEERIGYLLGRCGYSEREIRDICSGCFRFESRLIHLDYTDFVSNALVTDLEDVLQKAGSYPLGEMLNHYGITGCDHITGELSYLDKLEDLYVPQNIDDMKAYFKVRLALGSMRFLDRDAYEYYLETELDRTCPFSENKERASDFIFFSVISETPLSAAIDQLYLDRYFDAAAADNVMGYLNALREKYRILISAKENLSEESRAAILDKLDRITFQVMIPDNTADLSGVELVPAEESGSFLDAMCVLNRRKLERVNDEIQPGRGRTYWDIFDTSMSTTRMNAYYMRLQNTIYINAALLTPPFYDPDAPEEYNLACLVSLLGHEMSHAFDDTGILRDADGHWNELVTDADMEIWSSSAEKIIDFFSDYEPFEGSGSYSAASEITREAIADIEGLRACLMLAADREDFDYDLFFRSYAKHWAALNTKGDEIIRIKEDPHLLRYLRTNYTLMQFDEFYETYDIGPGDGMYLEPEQRIAIW